MSDSLANDQPRASTSKEGAAEPRVSLATTVYHDAPAPRMLDRTELQRHVRTVAPAQPPNSGFFAGSAANLAKLQTFLPTGTWVTYAALETWAFSLRPDDAPVSPTSNCNTHQRIALYIVIVFSACLAFFSSFVKQFIYDSSRVHVLYPPPDLFTVARRVTDPITGVVFPCRTPEKRYCWPLVGDTGGLVYDETGHRLRVLVFKLGVHIQVQRKAWWRRIWSAEQDVPEAPRLYTSQGTWPRHISVSSTFAGVSPDHIPTLDIDAVAATIPDLEPRWTRTLVGALGSRSYLDFRLRVWGHALVSLGAFLALALFSTQVYGCLYPQIPDYLPSTTQTAMLAMVALAAALFVQDDAVSLGQTPPKSAHRVGDDEEVPEYLRNVTEMLVWVGRQDFGVREKI